MLKYLTLLIVINISFNVTANSWQENYFKFNGVYSLSSLEQSTLYPDPTYVNKLTIQTSKQLLENGYGLNFYGAVSPFSLEQKQVSENSGFDYNFRLSGILFLSPINEATFGYIKKRELALYNNRLESFLTGISEELTSEIDKASFDLTFGKDRAFFFLNYQFNYLEQDSSGFITDEFVESIEKRNSTVDMLWRQSEDTQWGARVEFIKNQGDRFGNKYEYDIKNYYLSSVISYFNSSQLMTNLGISHTDDEEQFSWDLQHKTFISDNASFTVSAYRKFEQSLDNGESEDLNTRYKAYLHYSPLDYLSFKVNYSREKRKKEERLTYRKRAIAINTDFNYQESWTISAAYSSEMIDDYINARNISQNKIEIMILRSFI